MSNDFFKKIKGRLSNFWKEYEERLLFLIAIVLVAVVSFSAGQTRQKSMESEEIKVSLNNIEAPNPQQQKVVALGEAAQRKGVSLEENGGGNYAAQNQETECRLVGSENSDKFHKPDCTWAKKIKEENVVCFSSEEEARNEGYQPAGCCFKDN
ncbi:MAG: hypothetical protein U5L10_02910 [Candidatus Moranbacteria bacterium]|nr:hypothetical protein [Candidatus Moranbacteria bacterium]